MIKNLDQAYKLGLYDPSHERDNCGVGLIATKNKVATREVVTKAVDALKAIWHRGAVDADGKTGDGAGLMIEIPQLFFKEHARDTGHEP
mgnify:CR=1 FL=1